MKRACLFGVFSITTAENAGGSRKPFASLALTIILLCGAASPVSASADQALSATVIRNSTVYDAADLFAIYDEFLGGPVTAETADAIAAAVRERYRKDGYSRPGYTVADNGVRSGIVRIELKEASISGVEIGGESGPHSRRLQGLFADLPSSTSLRPEDIRRVLQEARRLPGLDVNISTQPDESGTGGFLLKVDSDFKAYAGSLTYTNRGTRQIGRDLVFARVQNNGAFGARTTAGVFVATAANASDYSSGGVFLRTPLGANDRIMAAQASVARIQVLSSGVVVDQDRERMNLKVSQPLPDWNGRKLSGWVALDLDNLDVYFDDAIAREDRLRSLQTGLSVAWRGGARQHLLASDVEFGLDVLGGQLDNYTSAVDERRNDFFIFRLHYVDLARLSEDWSLRVDTFAQHSPHILPSIKQFKVGGGRIGRGFDAAALSGDRGLGSKLELRRQLYAGLPVVDRLDGYLFYDIGAAWRHDTTGRESAASSGLGLTLRGERLSGYIELAQPLTHADADGNKDLGLFVELTGRF